MKKFDIYVEQTKEILYQKWKMTLQANPDLDLWPPCSIP